MRFLLMFACAISMLAQSAATTATWALPERVRLLQGQLIDLQVEVRNASAVTSFSVRANDTDLTSQFAAPAAARLDCDDTSDFVIRANLRSFNAVGNVRLTVSVVTPTGTVTDMRTIEVRPFSVPAAGRRNVILFIGDAMGTTYRDAARLVDRAVLDRDGKNSFRQGFFDNLLEMDKMPIAGMAMTYGLDSIIPDSANTGSNWSTGNKTYFNGVNVFPDGNDCLWRPTGTINATTLAQVTDNPRVETMWNMLKRLYGYRTGIVTTAAVTDATPAVQAAYTGFRQTRNEIARQYFENPMLGGRPAFDVIMGGGMDDFRARGRRDGRDLITEAQERWGFRYVTSAAELRSRFGSQPVLGLFKGSAAPAVNSNGVQALSDVNMDVAYDKLRFPRPASEPRPNFGQYPDQPMLELMTEKAIEVLSQDFIGRPFVLMVEGASIDKQSHPNHYAGTIWDTIELDRAIGVARKFAAARQSPDTLVVVTADHDQSMHIIGVSNQPDEQYLDNATRQTLTINSNRDATAQTMTVFGDSFTNVRSSLPFINSGGSGQSTGPLGPPAAVAGTGSSTNATTTYTTYQGFTAYRRDTPSGYPLNTAAPNTPIRRLAVGFRTGDHTGSSVPVTAEGPGAFLFTGYMDQTDIFFKIAAALTGDTEEGDKFVREVLTNSRYPKTVGK
jgi:alkaline phosphatase